MYENNLTISNIDYSYPHSSNFYKAASSCQLHVIHTFIFNQKIKTNLFNIPYLQVHQTTNVLVFIQVLGLWPFLSELMHVTSICIVNQFQFYWFLIYLCALSIAAIAAIHFHRRVYITFTTFLVFFLLVRMYRAHNQQLIFLNLFRERQKQYYRNLSRK